MMRSRRKSRPIMAPFPRPDIGRCTGTPVRRRRFLDHKKKIYNRKLQEAFWRIERQKIVVLEALSNSDGVGIRVILRQLRSVGLAAHGHSRSAPSRLSAGRKARHAAKIDSERPRKPSRAGG